jgi:hypothetical protein
MKYELESLVAVLLHGDEAHGEEPMLMLQRPQAPEDPEAWVLYEFDEEGWKAADKAKRERVAKELGYEIH